jgi:NADP-dependent 3-hydroxy acid dehydrogenase YdfG
LTARRIERLRIVKREIQESHIHIKIHIAELDVCDKDAIAQLVADLPTEFRDIDILINNAGLALDLEPLIANSDDAIDVVLDTNVKGLVHVTRAILPGMISRGRTADILNIGSVAGKQAYPNGAVYCASKHAVHALSQSLRMELVDTKIRVAEVSPGRGMTYSSFTPVGLVETEFSQIRFRGDEERARSVYEGLQPLTGGDVAEMVSFIASRPNHVQISELDCYPVNQASVYHVHRNI